MSRKRHYSEADKAAALALLDSNGGNVKATAAQLSMPRATLATWARGEHINRDVVNKYHEKKEELADIWDQVARAYLARALDESAVQGSNGQTAVTSAAIATDKLQLLQGKPTEVTEVRGSDAKRELAERLARLTARPSAEPSEAN